MFGVMSAAVRRLPAAGLGLLVAASCTLPDVHVSDHAADAGGATPVGGGARSTCDGNTCDADYPCEPGAPSHTCRGQFADWSPAALEEQLYVLRGNGTVFDKRSRLTWQSDVPATYSACGNGATACTWMDAGNYCKSLSLDGEGWRLPSKAELEDIVDDTRAKPAIDLKAFLDTPSEGFWTSSSVAGAPELAWNVYFSDGSSGNGSKNLRYQVRCVR